MKYIKTFENINLPDDVKVNNYALMNIKVYNKKIQNFINNNIGKIIGVDTIRNVFDKIVDYEIVVSYDDVPEEIKDILRIYSNDYRRRFDIKDIVVAGKTPEEILLKINADKYNL